jgi:hypothetical protein
MFKILESRLLTLHTLIATITVKIFFVNDLNCIILHIVVELAFSFFDIFCTLEAVDVKLQNLNQKMLNMLKY